MPVNTWNQLIALPNANLITLVEVNPAQEYIPGASWTLDTSNTYYHACAEVDVNAVTDDGVELTERATLQLCRDNAGSWYFDYTNQRIYVHCSDNYNLNSAGAPIPTIMVFMMKYFATENCEFNGYPYKALVPQDGLPGLDLSVDDIVEGVYKANFGSFKLMNADNWFDIASDTYIWTNRVVRIRLGGESLPYSEYQVFFVGRISDFEISDEEIIFSTNDIRINSFGKIPLNHYWIDDYANLDPKAEGRPIPIFYGVKTGIVPVCIDTTAGTGGKWKIAGHEIKEITAVRKNGYTLTETTHYTTDLANGELTLLVSFHFTDSDILEVDAKGLPDISDVLITKGGSIAKDILKTYLGFLDADLDLDSFTDADSKRTQELCLYLDSDVDAREVLQTIGRSIIAFFSPTENGKLSLVVYSEVIPTGTVELFDRDYVDWKVVKDDSFVRDKVIVKYNMNPGTQEWSTVEYSNPSIIYKYGVREALELETFLRLEADATNVADAIGDMVSKPMTVIETTVGLKGFSLFPTRKIKVTRDRAADSSGAFSGKPFRIRQVVKETSAERTRIVALDDLQTLGAELCEVCYSCQYCVTPDSSCSVCYSCQNCDVGESGCQLCNACQLCDTTQSGCVDCNTCQTCDTCQQSVGQCSLCEDCNLCQLCVVCETTVNTCSTCQDCYTCQSNVTLCGTCQLCNTCDNCNTCQVNVASCSTCQDCYGCQFCVGCEGTCEFCELCNFCHSGYPV